jgi:DNA-binding MarR family transcriptional regulator
LLVEFLQAVLSIHVVTCRVNAYIKLIVQKPRSTIIRILSINMQSQSCNFHFLLHSAHIVEERLRKRLAPLRVQPRQARILDAIGRMGATSQITLAEEMSVTQASMSTMIVRLVDLGFVTKKIDGNELRSNIVRLTKRGQNLLEQIYTLWSETDREIEKLIGAKHAKQLTEITFELRNALGGFTPGESKGE